MADEQKNQFGEGSDNYAGAAKQMANAAKQAGKTAAKETAVKGAEATATDIVNNSWHIFLKHSHTYTAISNES